MEESTPLSYKKDADPPPVFDAVGDVNDDASSVMSSVSAYGNLSPGAKAQLKKAKLLARAEALKEENEIKAQMLRLEMEAKEKQLQLEARAVKLKIQTELKILEAEQSLMLGEAEESSSAMKHFYAHDVGLPSPVATVIEMPPVSTSTTVKLTETSSTVSCPDHVHSTSPAATPVGMSKPDTHVTWSTTTHMPTSDSDGLTSLPLNAAASVFQPAYPSLVPVTQMQDTLSAYQQLASSLSLPNMEVPKFRGDVLDYTTFIMAFDARIAARVSSPADRLYYLDQYLEGEAKDLIGGCLYMQPEQGYNNARQLLQKEFGSPYKIANAYLQKLTSWPVVKHDDSAALRHYSHFLQRCKHAMCGVPLDVLNHPPNLQMVVRKLPTYLQNKWRDRACRIECPVFKDLVTFVHDSSEAVSHPIFGRDAISSSAASHAKNPQEFSRSSRPTKSKTSSYSTDVSSNKSKCLLCGKLHVLELCPDFKKKPLNDRREFVKSKRLCFGCLREGHVSRSCPSKCECDICGKKHPSVLHDGSFKSKPQMEDKSTSVESSYAMSDVSPVMHAILPVQVQQSNNGPLVHTYAFYDNGSSACFVTDDVLEKLGANGNGARLQMHTMHGREYIDTKAVEDLVVKDRFGNNSVCLPTVYSRPEISVRHDHIPRPHVLKTIPHLTSLAKKVPEYFPGLEIGLLIGSNCPEALQPLDVTPTDGKGPYGVLLRHGWTVNGPTSATSKSLVCNRVSLVEVTPDNHMIPSDNVLRLMELDFADRTGVSPNEKGLSIDDKRFLKIVEDGIRQRKDSHYEVPLPFRQKDVKMPDNKLQAFNRAQWQKKKMLRNSQYHTDYTTFVETVIEKGYAEKVPDGELDTDPGQRWYLPHHGIYHPKKPQKIRVVFDCSAKFDGVSLNDKLLCGPDLINSLVGVLTRFREEPIAILGDIEAMFHQVKALPQHTDFLRFLWWPNGDVNGLLQEYRMTVHLFGAISSPSVCNYALKRIAQDNDLPENVKTCILRNFYVDDCLKSVATKDDGVRLVQELRSACAMGGFKLTKFLSNSRDVMQSIPESERSQVGNAVSMNYAESHVERALGVSWFVTSDEFGFRIALSSKPATRRGILSTVSTVFDPLGIIAPVILPAKKILQELCNDNSLGWDDEIPDQPLVRWQRWIRELSHLEQLRVSRCFKPLDFGEVTSRQLHVYSDASTLGYASCAYLRLVNSAQEVHCSLVLGKARLTPTKVVTIPKLELTAATVSIRLGQMLLSELEYPPDNVTYHTDSMAVLHYIRNEAKRFPVFIANRIQTIRDFSQPRQWKYVDTKDNPADDGSRGLSSHQILSNRRWLDGPEYLWQHESLWNEQPACFDQAEDHEDVEVKVSATTVSDDHPFDVLLSHYSSWHRLCKAVVYYQRLKRFLHHDLSAPDMKLPVSLEDMKSAEKDILRFVQSKHFSSELKNAQRQINGDTVTYVLQVSKRSQIYSLDPFLDEDGLIRVGGRLSKARLDYDHKYPILLPRKSHVTTLVIRYYHERLQHVGRNHVLAAVRERFWVIAGNAAVRQVVGNCVRCRRARGPVTEQKMADLPQSRSSSEPPFTFTGLDYFGPFMVKEGRKQLKRWGVIFTCLSSRAVSLESANSLETDSFLNALRRFLCRRGVVKEVWSDNGTNFVGGVRELRRALEEIDQSRVHNTLLEAGVQWHFNPPGGSHMGGIWERQIRTVRKILMQLMQQFGSRVDDEMFRTLLAEAENIINSRPLTSVSGSPDDLEPLTPNHLLMLKPTSLSPPGHFLDSDLYCRRRWRHVQYLVEQFWYRWRREYFMNLQQRQKWLRPQRNLQIDDVVLLKEDNSPRNCWAMGRVISTEPGSDGLVRGVTVKTKSSELRRPVSKCVLLIANQS